MKFIFVTGTLAITVTHWVEQRPQDGSTESGARVEVRRYEEDAPEPYNAAPPARLLDPLWRADLFTHDQGEPGNWERAHQHTQWKGNQPGPRSWDPGMTSDPVGYTMGRLVEIETLLGAAAADTGAEGVDEAELTALLPAIRTAIETCLKPVPATSSVRAGRSAQ